METREKIRAALICHCKRYPKLQIRDMFKYIYQSSFGCEHMISSPEAVEDYIRKETEQYVSVAEEMIEPLDGDYCRVHLDVIREGLSASTLAKLFYLSAGHVEDGRERLSDKLSVLSEAVEEGVIPFEKEAVIEALKEWREADYPACHHSEVFRAAYAPAYRLIKKEYAVFLPLFMRIDRMLREGQRKRIEKRNTPELAKRFFEEWIPMEQRYFTEFKVKERCDMICKTEAVM